MPLDIAPVDVTPTRDGTNYYDVDVSSLVQNAGNLAGVIIRVQNTNISNTRSVGLRCNGSTDDHYLLIPPNAQTDIFVKVDSGDILEAKVQALSSGTGIHLWLHKEVLLSEGTGLTNRVIDSGGSDAWGDVDISGDTGSEIAKLAFLVISRDNGMTPGATRAGVRCNGSTDDEDTFYPTSGGASPPSGTGAWVVLDANEIYEAYNTSTSSAEFQLSGWLHSGFVGFVNSQPIHHNGAAGSYSDCFPVRRREYLIAAGSDDAHQIGTTVTLTGVTSTNDLDATTDWVGLRFDNFDESNGSTPKVYLAVRVGGSGTDEPDITIWCEDVDDSATFTTAASDISGRTRTTASVTFSVADLGVVAAKWILIDISGPVHEVLARPGWSNNNAVSVIIQGSATATRDFNFRMSENSSPQDAPRLYVDAVESEICIFGLAARLTTNAAVSWAVRTKGSSDDLYSDFRSTAAFACYTDSDGLLQVKFENASSIAYAVGYSSGPFTAVAGLTVGAATLAASASFSGGPSTYTASAALVAAAATLAASAEHDPPVYSASAALIVTPTVLAASADHDPPVYTASAALMATAATLAASVTFEAGTKTAAVSMETAAAVLAASAEHDPPVYTAVVDLGAAPAVIVAAASYSDPTYTATVVAVAAPAILSVSAEHDPPVYTASVALLAAPAELSASVEHDPPVYTASAGLTTAPAVLSALADHDPPTYTAASSLLVAGAVLTASVGFSLPTYTALASLTVSGATLSAFAQHETPTYTAAASLLAGAATLESFVDVSGGRVALYVILLQYVQGGFY